MTFVFILITSFLIAYFLIIPIYDYISKHPYQRHKVKIALLPFFGLTVFVLISGTILFLSYIIKSLIYG